MNAARFTSACLGGLFALFPVALTPIAQAKVSFGDCAKQLEKRGYEIYEMELKGSTYDIDARKAGRWWDVRANQNCQIIDERPD
jgi:hypothetical protein